MSITDQFEVAVEEVTEEHFDHTMDEAEEVRLVFPTTEEIFKRYYREGPRGVCLKKC